MSGNDNPDSVDRPEREGRARAQEVQPESREPVLVFPYLYGPATRRFGTSLLWHGRLICSGGSFGSPYPPLHFNVVGPASAGTPIEQVFAVAAHYGMLGKKQMAQEVENLADLTDFINLYMLVGPGNTRAYDKWEPYLPTCLAQAASMLEDTQVVTAAANEFVWRIYEMSLEMGAEPERPLGDPKRVVRKLAEHAAQLGSPQALLAECLLNRHWVLGPTTMSIVTDQAPAIGIYASVGRAVLGEPDDLEANRRVLAFTLFDTLIREHMPPLERPHTGRIAKVLQARAGELKAARAKCLEEAMRLLNERPAGDKLGSAIEVSLGRLHEEISAVLEIDHTAFKELVRSLTENEKLWITLAGVVGGLLGSVPDFASAAAAVTAFSILGTTALKQARARRDLLRDSPWAFVYLLQR